MKFSLFKLSSIIFLNIFLFNINNGQQEYIAPSQIDLTSLSLIPAELNVFYKSIHGLNTENIKKACSRAKAQESGASGDAKQCIGQILGKLPTIRTIIALLFSAPEKNGILVNLFSGISSPRAATVNQEIRNISNIIIDILDTIIGNAATIATILGITIPNDPEPKALEAALQEAIAQAFNKELSNVLQPIPDSK